VKKMRLCWAVLNTTGTNKILWIEHFIWGDLRSSSKVPGYRLFKCIGFGDKGYLEKKYLKNFCLVD
jgi:hypothetical protein